MAVFKENTDRNMLTWKRMGGLPKLQTQCAGRREFSDAREGRDALVIYIQIIKEKE